MHHTQNLLEVGESKRSISERKPNQMLGCRASPKENKGRIWITTDTNVSIFNHLFDKIHNKNAHEITTARSSGLKRSE